MEPSNTTETETCIAIPERLLDTLLDRWEELSAAIDEAEFHCADDQDTAHLRRIFAAQWGLTEVMDELENGS